MGLVAACEETLLRVRNPERAFEKSFWELANQ